MKMQQICRTCLQEITDMSFVILNGDPRSLQVASQLSLCVPEIDLSLIKEPILCGTCVSMLHLACTFKNKCLRTEEHIWNYKHEKDCSNHSVDILDIFEPTTVTDATVPTPPEAPEVDQTASVIQNNQPLPKTEDNVIVKEELVDYEFIRNRQREMLNVNPEIGQNLENNDHDLHCNDYESNILPKLKDCWVVLTDIYKNNIKNVVKQEPIDDDDDYVQNLKQPSTSKRNSNNYSCDICNFKCGSKKQFQMHNKTHTVEKPFKCSTPNKKRHVHRKGVDCVKCKFNAEYKGIITNHKKNDLDNSFHIPPNSCIMCGERFAKTYDLINHKRTFHASDDCIFKCTFCAVKFTDKYLLKRHLEEHFNEDILINSNTGEFNNSSVSDSEDHSSVSSVELELKLKTESIIKNENIEQELICVMCDTVFDSKTAFLEHLKSHIW